MAASGGNSYNNRHEKANDRTNTIESCENTDSNREQLARPQVPSSCNNDTIRNAREYAQALRPWLWHQQNLYAIQSFAANFAMQLHMMSSLNAINNNYTFTQPVSSHIGTPLDPYASRRPQQFYYNGAVPHVGQNQQAGNQGQATEGVQGGTEHLQGVLYKIPTFWKRVAAELIDFTCLFYIKMVVSICLMSELSLDNVTFISSEDLIESFSSMDYDRAFALTFEVIALEIINRILITIFETLCLYRTVAGGEAIGATPGKRLMGLRVVSCDSVRPVGQTGQVLVSPAGNISLGNAFLRSVIKNFTIAFFLPACLTLFFFKHNRTAYDIIAHTIVVEDLA